ncbi:MAG: ATP-binding protein [Clostridiales bacterium]|nr:ATP-binding protein [Clostridiales bacterium]
MLQNIDQLILFNTIREDGVLSLLSKHDFNAAQRLLADEAGGLLHGGGISGSLLQNRICRLMAGEENVFARMAEAGAFSEMEADMDDSAIKALPSPQAKAVFMQAICEIEIISNIYRHDYSEHTFLTLPAANGNETSHRETIHLAMMKDSGTKAAVLLTRHYHGYGSGVFEASSAMTAEEGGLVPVRHMDAIVMDGLVGYERQKRILTDNIKILLSGARANNVLLYGDSGTGKSSSVKALLNLYASNGLKLISITKDRLHLLPGVFESIAGRGMKFIIFIDDLSFDENEHEYKLFKSIVEGRVAPRPQNAIFIVTTNRKNIVKDVWSDRGGEDDVRRRDNMEEKRSLSDRFGLTLVYPAPDKQEYLAIVRGIADRAGLSMPDEELAAEALKWEIRHGGRSGRTAQQFIDHMAGLRKIGEGGLAQ